jgi:hypothetical protein
MEFRTDALKFPNVLKFRQRNSDRLDSKCDNVLKQDTNPKPADLEAVADQAPTDVFINDSDAHFYDYINHLMKQLLCKSSARLSAGGTSLARVSQLVI